MKQNTKRLLHLGGGLLSILLLGYLVLRFIELHAAVTVQIREGLPFGRLALAAVVSLLAYVPIALGWVCLAVPFGTRRTFRVALRIVLLSQAARYLPGNVGHLVGRVMLTRKYFGVTAANGSALLTIELLLSLAAAALLSFAALPELAALAPAGLAELLRNPWVVVLCVAGTILGVIFAGVLARRWFNLTLPSWRTVVVAGICYAGSLVIGGISLWLILSPGNGAVSIGLALLAYTTSWLAGFVTPGAPSGLGVREFVLVRLLAPVIGEPAALLAAALLRLCSVSADAVAFMAGLALGRTVQIASCGQGNHS
jgi:uncharacterized membrane protein YbhN (UPF0104 family)